MSSLIPTFVYKGETYLATRQTHSLRHWEFLQLHGFLGLLVVIVCRGGPLYVEGEGEGSMGVDGSNDELKMG